MQRSRKHINLILQCVNLIPKRFRIGSVPGGRMLS